MSSTVVSKLHLVEHKGNSVDEVNRPELTPDASVSLTVRIASDV
jgi:hypothetical protein